MSREKGTVLEVVSSIISKEWNRISHHPYVSSAAVEIGLAPFPIIISNIQDLIVHHDRLVYTEAVEP